MPKLETLSRQRNLILAKIAALGPMRPGTICSQKVKYHAKDGSIKENGPYKILTAKEDGKTRTLRLQSDEEVKIAEKQIENFREFQKLTKELNRIGKQLADCEMIGKTEGKKNSTRTSGPSRKRKQRRSSSD